MEKLKKANWKTWAVVGLGGVAAVLAGALVIQWPHASLGRQISRNVITFLKDHGAQVKNGVISGGVVSTPLKQNTAVNATVVQMLNAVADQMESVGNGTRGSVDADDSPVYTRTPRVGKRPATSGGRKGPPPTPKPRGSKSPKQQADSPLGIGHPPDDGGFGDPNRKVSTEYNPDEFRPPGAGRKPPSGTVDFTDDETVGPVEDYE